MGTFYNVCVVFLLSLGLLHFSSSSASSLSLSFSLTYIDAETSLLRSVEADPSDLPEGMPMRDFVAAGRALRGRIQNQKERSQSIRGDVSYHRQKAGDFYLSVPVGTPPQDLIFLVDTGSEITWSQCSPCTFCNDTHAPLFASNESSSFLTVPCDSPLCDQSSPFTVGCGSGSAIGSSCTFIISYGDGRSFAGGSIATDSFHLHPNFSNPFVFGCAAVVFLTSHISSSGLMGLSPGSLSFTSQLFGGDKLDIPHKFAHCLPDRFTNLNAPGRIQFGDYELTVHLSYTQLVPNDLYYIVNLEGITVGEIFIKGDTEVEGVRQGWTIFDSGTAVTNLVGNVYNEFVEEMRKQTANLSPFAPERAPAQLCYMAAADAEEPPQVPVVTLHFAGMVDLELGPASILYADHSDNTSTQFCLAFDTSDDYPNIIGNYQQQNYWVEYNLQTSSLGLAKTNCAQL